MLKKHDFQNHALMKIMLFIKSMMQKYDSEDKSMLFMGKACFLPKSMLQKHDLFSSGISDFVIQNSSI